MTTAKINLQEQINDNYLQHQFMLEQEDKFTFGAIYHENKEKEITLAYVC